MMITMMLHITMVIMILMIVTMTIIATIMIMTILIIVYLLKTRISLTVILTLNQICMKMTTVIITMAILATGTPTMRIDLMETTPKTHFATITGAIDFTPFKISF